MTKINMDNPLQTSPKSKGETENRGVALLTIVTAHDCDRVLGSECELPGATDPS